MDRTEIKIIVFILIRIILPLAHPFYRTPRVREVCNLRVVRSIHLRVIVISLENICMF